MKTLKNLVLAASIYALTTACGQTNPSPESKVAVTPPTPVINKCDNVKNPLEDVDWIKEIVASIKTRTISYKLTQYTYQNKPIYFGEYPEQACYGFANCDKSINVFVGGCGAAGTSIESGKLYDEIIKNATNPIILFEQK
jgi:hypothetical protein